MKKTSLYWWIYKKDHVSDNDKIGYKLKNDNKRLNQ